MLCFEALDAKKARVVRNVGPGTGRQPIEGARVGLQLRELLDRGDVDLLRGLLHSDALDGIAVDHVVLSKQLLREPLLSQEDVTILTPEPIDAQESQRGLRGQRAFRSELPQRSEGFHRGLSYRTCRGHHQKVIDIHA